MATQITAISISREMQARPGNMWKTTEVFFHRNAHVTKHETNPIVSKQRKISEASVIRAKRAQLALMERADRDAE